MTSRTLDDTNFGMATDTTYTYERTPGPDILHEVARDYDIQGHCGGTFAVGQWSVTVRRKGGGVIGQSFGTFEDAMKKAREIAEADALTRAPPELPPIWWGGAEAAS